MPTARVARRVLALVLGASLLPIALAQATHSPAVGDVVAQANSFQMGCEQFATEVQCTGGIYYFREPIAFIRPANSASPLHDVVTQTNAHSNGQHDFLDEDRVWMTAVHAAGCSDSETETTAVRGFMDQVATALEPSIGPGPFSFGPSVIGECTMTGRLFQPALTAFWRYEISSLTTGAFPTPTPQPTPRPTPVPTPIPTPTPTPTPSPSPSPSPEPTASESESVEPSPEGTVGGIVFTPEPSDAAPDAAPAGATWTSSVPGPADVSTEPAALASSALLALLLLLFMGFVGELFNNTAKANYDVLAGWWSNSWLGRHLRRFTDFWKSP